MHGKRTLIVFLVAILFISTVASAAVLSGCWKKEAVTWVREPSGAPVQKIPDDKKLTFDDVLYAEYVSEMAISPDGASLAWCKDFCQPGMEIRGNNLFLTSLTDGASAQLTFFDSAVIGGLKWSPDGGRIGFLSNAPLSGEEGGGGVFQVWAVEPSGQGLAPLTQLDQGVGDFGWKDAETILYTAEEKQEGDVGQAGDDTIHVSEYCEAPVRLFEMDLSSEKVTRLTDNDDRIIHLSVSPDGKYAFYVRTMSKMDELQATYYGDIPFTNHLLDLEIVNELTVFEETKNYGGGGWSPDSSTFFAVDRWSEDQCPFTYTAKVRTRDIQTGQETLVDLDWGRGLETMNPFGLPTSPVRPTADGFIAILADGCHPKIARCTRSGDGWNKTLLEGEHQGNIFYIEVTADGKTVCYDHSTASKPPQIYTARLDDGTIIEPRAITELNPDFNNKMFTRSEAIVWTGARGDPVEGMLFYPEGYEPGKRYPLMLVIHGGPYECDKDRWQTLQWVDPYHILSQKGAFVLAPNYHGSSGYGKTSEDFASSINNGWFLALVSEDIERAIEGLVDLGMVDEDKLGTMGWSGGSIISNALIARDQRFKVASCGAGGAEWVSEWGQAIFGNILVTGFLGCDPIENPDVYKDPSIAPFYDAAKVKTPVIMFQPAEDINVVPAMTWVTYRGIQKHGSAPVELFVFPGEGHVLEKISHQLRKMVEEQKWFDEYFFKE
ncbi:MAG TPA: S9 family peptidase [Dehalococcoidia bacterium]|nr:S9 family peptidase [Dehalococcoidia bacterium]